METLRQYVISVVAGAIVCGIAKSLFPKGPGGAIMKMLCGLILSLCVLRPMVRVDFLDILQFEGLHFEDALRTSAMGEEYSARAQRDIIKSETEAYILDKARALGAGVTAEVSLSADTPPIPAAVRITGNLSPYARYCLSAYISGELGISKENQVWTS